MADGGETEQRANEDERCPKPENRFLAVMAKIIAIVKSHRDDILAISTALTVVVLGLQFWMLYKTDQTARAGQRAYVSVSEPALSAAYSPFGEPYAFIIPMKWVNGGNSEARNLTISSGCSDVEPNLLWVSDQEPYKWPLLPKGEALIPACRISPPNIRTYRDMKKPFYIFGQATYRDVFEEFHLVRFCVAITSISGDPAFYDMKGSFIPCRTNNCSDESCQTNQ